MRVWAVLCLVMLAAGWCRADIINLTDGTKVEGKIRKSADGWTVTEKDGTVVTVDADKVASIEASRSPDATY